MCAKCAGVFISSDAGAARVAPALLISIALPSIFILTLSVTCLPNGRFGCRPHCKSFVAFCVAPDRLCASKRTLCGVHGRARTGNVCRVKPTCLPPLGDIQHRHRHRHRRHHASRSPLLILQLIHYVNNTQWRIATPLTFGTNTQADTLLLCSKYCVAQSHIAHTHTLDVAVY